MDTKGGDVVVDIKKEDDNGGVMALDTGDVGLDVMTWTANTALAFGMATVVAGAAPPPAPAAAAAAVQPLPLVDRCWKTCKTVLLCLGWLLAFIIFVGTWLLSMTVSISALILLNHICEKPLHIWLFIHSLIPVLARTLSRISTRYPNLSQVKKLRSLVSMGYCMSVVTGCVMTYQIPIRNHTCVDWLYYSSFVVATLNLVYVTLLCMACCGVIQAVLRNPAVRAVRHVAAYDNSNIIIAQQPTVQQLRQKILPTNNSTTTVTTAISVVAEEEDLRRRLCPEFRILDASGLTMDPVDSWRAPIHEHCFGKTSRDLTDLVLLYMREYIWAVSAQGYNKSKFGADSTISGTYELSMYNPYLGHVVPIVPMSPAPPLRYNAMIRALPRNGLILVLGGIKAVDRSDGKKEEEDDDDFDGNEHRRKAALHIIQRVDMFNVRTKQWERTEQLKLDGPMLELQPSINDNVFGVPAAAAQAIVDAVVVHSADCANESLLVLGPTNITTNSRPCRMLSVADRKWLPQAEIPASSHFSSLATHPTQPSRLFSFGGVARSDAKEDLLTNMTSPAPHFTVLPLPSPQQHFDRQLSILINNTATTATTTCVAAGWSSLPDMRLARFQPTVCCVENGFVVAGGDVSDDRNMTVVNVESYSFTTNKWTKLPDLPCLLSNSQKNYQASPVIIDCTRPQLATLYNNIIHYAPFGFCIQLTNDNNNISRTEWQHISPDTFEFQRYKHLLFSSLLSV